MSVPSATSVPIRQPILQAFREDVIWGLSQPINQLPCKYFYDQRGSLLFDAICRQPEYYLTRTELQIMQRHVAEMADELGGQLTLIELGSGSSLKTRELLASLCRPAAYVPIDISREHLLASAHRLRHRFKGLEIVPVCADFTAEFDLPPLTDAHLRRVVYFPGSTIGNFENADAVVLLKRMAALCGPGGGLLIGVDLVKDADVIHRAYNDAAGVTARFNLNLLRWINRELGGDFDLGGFQHSAFYDSRHRRVEMQLVSRRRQRVRIDGAVFDFTPGEPIRTEYSHKYTVEDFAQLAEQAGWKLGRCWTDRNRYFAVLYLINEDWPATKLTCNGHSETQ